MQTVLNCVFAVWQVARTDSAGAGSCV